MSMINIQRFMTMKHQKLMFLRLIQCCYISALVLTCFRLTKKRKQLLPVSYTLWCYYSKCYSIKRKRLVQRNAIRILIVYGGDCLIFSILTDSTWNWAQMHRLTRTAYHHILNFKLRGRETYPSLVLIEINAVSLSVVILEPTFLIGLQLNYIFGWLSNKTSKGTSL